MNRQSAARSDSTPPPFHCASLVERGVKADEKLNLAGGSQTLPCMLKISGRHIGLPLQKQVLYFGKTAFLPRDFFKKILEFDNV
jgi:hypothetical protein